jgi:uncharacterized protein
MNNIYISQEEKDLILQLLNGNYEILVFGSRMTGKHLPFSDLDICLKSKKAIDPADLEELRGLLEESSLPFVVDLMDYSVLNETFKKLIDNHAISLQSALVNH